MSKLFVSTKEHIPICKYFQQSNCFRGDKCQFRHDQKSVPPFSSQVVCQHFLRGSCQYGTSCRNKHTGPATTNTNDSEVKQCAFYLKNACAKGTSCTFSHDVPLDKRSALSGKESVKSNPASPFGPCKFFTQGRCMKGITCPFPHETGNAGLDPASSLHTSKKVLIPRSISNFIPSHPFYTPDDPRWPFQFTKHVGVCCDHLHSNYRSTGWWTVGWLTLIMSKLVFSLTYRVATKGRRCLQPWRDTCWVPTLSLGPGPR
jgi:hypothetical protein